MAPINKVICHLSVTGVHHHRVHMPSTIHVIVVAFWCSSKVLKHLCHVRIMCFYMNLYFGHAV